MDSDIETDNDTDDDTETVSNPEHGEPEEELKTPREAMRGKGWPYWSASLKKELDALAAEGVWKVVIPKSHSILDSDIETDDDTDTNGCTCDDDIDNHSGGSWTDGLILDDQNRHDANGWSDIDTDAEDDDEEEELAYNVTESDDLLARIFDHSQSAGPVPHDAPMADQVENDMCCDNTIQGRTAKSRRATTSPGAKLLKSLPEVL